MSRITDPQRQRILRLFKSLEWDTIRVTGFHKLADAGAAKFEGRPVDEYLDSISKADASQFIARLERLAC